MKKLYTAAFIVPPGVKSLLTEDGWEFIGSDRIGGGATAFLVTGCGLIPTSSYNAVNVFEGEIGKASVVRDKAGRIENIFFQLNKDGLAKLKSAYGADSISCHTQLFVPSEEF